MKVIFFFCLLLQSISSYSQKVTLKDLINKTSCKDYDCFSDYITSERFSIQDSTDEKNGTFYIFMSNQDFPINGDSTIKTKNIATFIANNTGSINTSIRTTTSEYYQELLSQLKALEFKSIRTKIIYEAVIVIYKSKLYPKMTIEVKKDKLEKDNHSWISYMFTIIKAS